MSMGANNSPRSSFSSASSAPFSPVPAPAPAPAPAPQESARAPPAAVVVSALAGHRDKIQAEIKRLEAEVCPSPLLRWSQTPSVDAEEGGNPSS